MRISRTNTVRSNTTQPRSTQASCNPARLRLAIQSSYSLPAVIKHFVLQRQCRSLTSMPSSSNWWQPTSVEFTTCFGHRRSQDFLWGCTYPARTKLTTPTLHISPISSKITIPLPEGCTCNLGVHLQLSPVNLPSPKKCFFFAALRECACTPWLRLWFWIIVDGVLLDSSVLSTVVQF